MKTPAWKIVLAFLPIILIGAVTLYFSGIFGITIPEFAAERLDGRTFTKDNIRPDVPVIIAYIDVNCDDCNKVVDEITGHAEAFSKTHVLLISSQTKIDLGSFAVQHDLRGLHFISLLRDPNMKFEQAVKSITFPTVLVYSKSHRLLKRFDGPPPTGELATLVGD